jgi:hypothetical protein
MEEILVGSPAKIENKKILLSEIQRKIPTAVETKIRNFLTEVYNTNRHLNFYAGLNIDDAITIFLYWLVEYPSIQQIGIYFNYKCFSNKMFFLSVEETSC